MGLCGQRLVQDKDVNPPNDRKYVIILSVSSRYRGPNENFVRVV